MNNNSDFTFFFTYTKSISLKNRLNLKLQLFYFLKGLFNFKNIIYSNVEVLIKFFLNITIFISIKSWPCWNRNPFKVWMFYSKLLKFIYNFRSNRFIEIFLYNMISEHCCKWVFKFIIFLNLNFIILIDWIFSIYKLATLIHFNLYFLQIIVINKAIHNRRNSFSNCLTILTYFLNNILIFFFPTFTNTL